MLTVIQSNCLNNQPNEKIGQTGILNSRGSRGEDCPWRIEANPGNNS